MRLLHLSPNLSYVFFKNLKETNFSLINRVLGEIGYKMIENTINSTINMTTRDTKDGIADLICELLAVNRKVRVRNVMYTRFACASHMNFDDESSKSQTPSQKAT